MSVNFTRQLPALFSNNRLLRLFSVHCCFDLATGVTTTFVASKQQCTLNSRNSRLLLNKAGNCRVKLTLTKPNATVVAFYNLAIR